MNKSTRSFLITLLIVVATLAAGQAISYLLAPASWQAFIQTLPVILSMIAFWGPIIAIIAILCVWGVCRMLGFSSIEDIRRESVDENNPAPAIIFVGTMIAAILFLLVVIRP